VAVTGDPKWHERTPTVVMVSLAALAAIGLIVWLTMFVLRQANTVDTAPLEFVTPVFSDTSTTGTTTGTTTSTITSTVAPETTEITDPSATDPSSTDPSSTDPATTDPSVEATEPSESSTERTTTERSRPSDTEDDDADTTTRRRPRLNETRILNPIQ
jgi:hypothetical protein